VHNETEYRLDAPQSHLSLITHHSSLITMH